MNLLRLVFLINRIRNSLVVLLIFSGSMFLQAQNLILNPYLKDMNMCCEYSAECRPEAWFSAPNRNAIYFKNDRKLFSINSRHPAYEVYNSYDEYYIVALSSQIDTSEKYQLELWMPQNRKVSFLYTFTDSSLIYTDDKKMITNKIDSMQFDSTILRGKKVKFTFKPNKSGGFLVFKFQTNKSYYSQQILFMSLTPSVYKQRDVETMEERRKKIYAEDRAHFFMEPCSQKTLIQK